MMVTLSTILIAAMAIGLLIVLSLILTMWIRGRKREIGILSSLGIKSRQYWHSVHLRKLAWWPWLHFCWQECS